MGCSGALELERHLFDSIDPSIRALPPQRCPRPVMRFILHGLALRRSETLASQKKSVPRSPPHGLTLVWYVLNNLGKRTFLGQRTRQSILDRNTLALIGHCVLSQSLAPLRLLLPFPASLSGGGPFLGRWGKRQTGKIEGPPKKKTTN